MITAFYIRMDARYLIFNRQVYSVLEYLGDIGGLQQMLYLIGLMIITYFSQRLFSSSVMTEMYQVKHDRGLVKSKLNRQKTLTVDDINRMNSKKRVAIKPLRTLALHGDDEESNTKAGKTMLDRKKTNSNMRLTAQAGSIPPTKRTSERVDNFITQEQQHQTTEWNIPADTT